MVKQRSGSGEASQAGGDLSRRRNDHETSPHDTTAIRYPHRLLIRMTREERRQLGRKAHAAEVSLSRFIIECAMRGKAPPSQAERAELESLMFLIRRTANILNRLVASTSAMRLVGADKETEGELKKAADLLLRLLSELRRRQ